MGEAFLLGQNRGKKINYGNVTEDKVLEGTSFATEDGLKTGTMPNIGRQVILPGTSSKTISRGYHDGTGYVMGDINLKSENIKAGEEIFGVEGKDSVVDTEDATASPSDILSGKTAYVDGQKVTGTMSNKGSLSVTPGSSSKSYGAGYYSSIYVAGDSNLNSENIKSGKTIFGVSGKSSVVDTEDATATASNILSGKTAYVDGEEVIGTMPNIGQQIITPGTTSKSISKGYHNGYGYVQGSTNLKPENIKSGVNIFGVVGTLESFHINSGYVRLDLRREQWVSSNKNCGFTPKLVMVMSGYTYPASFQFGSYYYAFSTKNLPGFGDIQIIESYNNYKWYSEIGTNGFTLYCYHNYDNTTLYFPYLAIG